MILETLRILAFRNIPQAELSFDSRLNLLYGANGAGKTSVLEAIHFLGTARSFRSSHAGDAIHFGADGFTLAGCVSKSEDGSRWQMGIQRTEGRSRLQIDGLAQRSSSSMAELLPLLLITPESIRYLYGGSAERRVQLDWALFHGDADYRAHSRRHVRALSQRNSLLKQGVASVELQPWEQVLAVSADFMHRRREAYCCRFERFLNDWLGDGLEHPIQMAYSPGWDTAEDFADSLKHHLARDRELGHTTTGPHRADIVYTTDARPLSRVLSRGQAKLFVNGVLTAQTALLRQERGVSPVVLVDDLPAEFDGHARERFLALLQKMETQLFITSTEAGLVPIATWPTHTMFHVEQGHLTSPEKTS